MRYKLFALLACIAIFIGCKTTESKLAVGGAYAATETVAAKPELFLLDSSFDVAYSGLDTVFKYEKQNRGLLWRLSPNIKRSLDKLRKEAGVVNVDYAIARQVYLTNSTPSNLNELQSTLAKLQAANAAALTVIQTKGVK